MARPASVGASYFPKDCGFYRDDKIKILRSEFGAKGMYFLDYLLCELYEKEGYYMQWDKRKCYLVSDGAGCGCSPKFAEEMITRCVQESFFDKRVLNMFGVLTSCGIQRRFIRMLNKRTNFTFIEEYFLLDKTNEEDVPAGILNKLTFRKITGTENGVFGRENPINSTGNDTNKSKLKKSKLNKKKRECLPPLGEYGNVFLTEEELVKFRSCFPNWKERINRLSEYMESTGKTYQNHYVTLLSWARKDGQKQASVTTLTDDDLLALELQERRMRKA